MQLTGRYKTDLRYLHIVGRTVQTTLLLEIGNNDSKQTPKVTDHVVWLPEAKREKEILS